jgi:hypothetical protein
VLQVAHELFYWHGIRATGIDQVAAEAALAGGPDPAERAQAFVKSILASQDRSPPLGRVTSRSDSLREANGAERKAGQRRPTRSGTVRGTIRGTARRRVDCVYVNRPAD